jgi:Zn-dependent protease
LAPAVPIDVVTGFVWFVSFLFSTTVHEAMHALAAWRLGDPTAYNGGQVSLSPLPHIRREPIGMLVLPLVTAFTQGWAIGWASAPYDRHWAERYPQRAAVMAAAGPAGNFMIAVGAFVLMRAGLGVGAFVSPDSVNFENVVAGANGQSTFATMLLSVLLVQNVLLGLFNLLPVPPLDGGAVAGAVLPEPLGAAVRQFGNNPMGSMVGLIVAWQLFPAMARSIFSLLLSAVHPGVPYGPG